MTVHPLLKSIVAITAQVVVSVAEYEIVAVVCNPVFAGVVIFCVIRSTLAVIEPVFPVRSAKVKVKIPF